LSLESFAAIYRQRKTLKEGETTNSTTSNVGPTSVEERQIPTDPQTTGGGFAENFLVK